MVNRILWVDDEANVVQSVQRILRRRFDIVGAGDGHEALDTLQRLGPFGVIVSDMRMPGMDGVQLLGRVRELAPDTVRIMFTGQTDRDTAIEAVNEGSIFRFLTKPIAPDVLAKALEAAFRQYQLVTAERELLEKTLGGAVRTLMEILALTHPTAFGRASRVRLLVRELARILQVSDAWQIELAAMLSQVGSVTVPEHTLMAVVERRELTPNETRMMAAHPGIGRELIGRIPRLEPVAEIIGYQLKNFDGSGIPNDGVAGEAIPLGARILRAALDYDNFVHVGISHEMALQRLQARPDCYAPAVLEALALMHARPEPEVALAVTLDELAPGMVLAEDVTSENGVLVISEGQEVTDALCHRLRNFALLIGLERRFRVRLAA